MSKKTGAKDVYVDMSDHDNTVLAEGKPQVVDCSADIGVTGIPDVFQDALFGISGDKESARNRALIQVAWELHRLNNNLECGAYTIRIHMERD